MKTPWIVVAIACTSFPVHGLIAQMQWSPIAQHPSVSPGWVYDSSRDRVVAMAFPGSQVGVAEFDGLTWQIPAALPPQHVVFSCFGFDDARGRTVWLGENSSTLAMETWQWDGQRWFGTPNRHGPTSRTAPMTFNPARRTLMMFGGWLGNLTNELWEWDGRQWHEIKDRNAPPCSHAAGEQVSYSSLAYDYENDTLVVFGRAVRTSSTQIFPETWEWTSSLGWRLVSNAGPSAINRWLVYDQNRRTMILLTQQAGQSQTWERSGGSNWVLRSQSGGQYPIYDSRRGRTLVPFAQYAPNLPADFTTTGAGCPGTLGTPSLELTESWTRAWIGDVLSVTVHNLPQSAAILVTGFSTQATGGIALPADLGVYGMPGCSLRVAVDDYAPLVGSNGSATHARSVPQSFALLGFAYHMQAVALDPAANAFGATMSNAVTGHVGQR